MDIYVIETEEYVLRHQRKKAKKFKEALDLFDQKKTEWYEQVKRHEITEEEYHADLEWLADYLDL